MDIISKAGSDLNKARLLDDHRIMIVRDLESALQMNELDRLESLRSLYRDDEKFRESFENRYMRDAIVPQTLHNGSESHEGKDETSMLNEYFDFRVRLLNAKRDHYVGQLIGDDDGKSKAQELVTALRERSQSWHLSAVGPEQFFPLAMPAHHLTRFYGRLVLGQQIDTKPIEAECPKSTLSAERYISGLMSDVDRQTKLIDRVAKQGVDFTRLQVACDQLDVGEDKKRDIPSNVISLFKIHSGLDRSF